MKITLVGPDELGFWYLHDEHGNSWQVVERQADHTFAAELFGWSPGEGEQDDETTEEARLWLLDHIGDEIEAPRHIAEYFEELVADDED